MIILIRHGETTSNARGLLVGRSDPELTALGERQAIALRPLLGNVQSVWVSPLSRARATAALALPDVSAQVCTAFIEVDYGSLENQPMTTLTFDEWRTIEAHHDRALGGGESLGSVDTRVHEELQTLLADDQSLLHSHVEHLAIVTHVSPIKSAAAWALGVPGSVAWRMRLDNGSITTLAVRRTRPLLVNFNVVPHQP